MQLTKINQEVIFVNDRIIKVDRQDVAHLKADVLNNERHRIRLCMHESINHDLHEMFLVLTNKAYIRPHKHLNKIESFHVIEGEVEIVIFDDTGKISEVISLGDYKSECKFYYRISNSEYHTLMIKSDLLVIHETTDGPFRKSDTIYAPWAPAEDDLEAGQEYLTRLAMQIP